MIDEMQVPPPPNSPAFVLVATVLTVLAGAVFTTIIALSCGETACGIDPGADRVAMIDPNPAVAMDLTYGWPGTYAAETGPTAPSTAPAH